MFYNNILVSVIGIGKSRYEKKTIHELHRFCNKSFTIINGCFSKLLSHARKNINFNSLISYIDCSHYSGNGYEQIGFTFLSYTVPNYKYINKRTNLRITRETAQKHKLNKLLGNNFNPLLTEYENMINNDYLCLYDACNIKVKYTKDNKI